MKSFLKLCFAATSLFYIHAQASVEITSFTVNEGDGVATATVTVNRSSDPSSVKGGAGNTVFVSVRTVDGTAKDESPPNPPFDYSAVSRVLRFDPGTSKQEVDIPLNDDLEIEPTEEFYLEAYQEEPGSNLLSASEVAVPGPDARGTITVEDNDTEIVVNIDFLGGAATEAEVTLTCSTGNVGEFPGGNSFTKTATAGDGGTASFPVYNYDPDNFSCLAKQTNPPPAGYVQTSNSCVPDFNTTSQVCLIENTLNSDTIRVEKKYTNSTTTAVDVTINCDSGNVNGTGTTTDTKSVSANPGDFASFTVTGFNQVTDASGKSTSCTVTESNLPDNYLQKSAVNCTQTLINQDNSVACQFTNEPNRATFTVIKEYLEGPNLPVPVQLTCSSGEGNPGNGQASQGNPETLAIEGFNSGQTGTTNCTVTEIEPDGYVQISATGCSVNGVQPGQNYTCKFVNALPTARFTVSKDFSDNNPAEVAVTLSCDTGQILDQTKMIKEGSPVTFVVTDFVQGTLNCSVTEEDLTGYTASYTNVSQGGASSPTSCSYSNVNGGNNDECRITNNLDDIKVRVTKKWMDAHPDYNAEQTVEVKLTCKPKGGSPYTVGEQKIFPVPGYTDFTFKPSYLTETCAVSEMEGEDFVADVSDCAGLMVAPGVGDACTVENTRLYEGIPTLSQYGLAILALLMLGIGMVGFRRFV
jgi:hypothetical protein